MLLFESVSKDILSDDVFERERVNPEVIKESAASTAQAKRNSQQISMGIKDDRNLLSVNMALSS